MATKQKGTHIPEKFWCYVCGKVENKEDTPLVRLVTRENTNLFPTFRIGETALINPKPPPAHDARYNPSKVVDGYNKEVSRVGRKYVGYACNGAFQLKAASNHHNSGVSATEAARLSAPGLRSAEAKQQEEKEKELLSGGLLSGISRCARLQRLNQKEG